MKLSTGIVALLSLLIGGLSAQAETTITPQKLPFEGQRPVVATGKDGSTHLIFNRQGNVFYSWMPPGTETFGEPIQVNTVDGCAAASDLAVGPEGRVHIFYHGNIFYVRKQVEAENRKLQGSDIKYSFYSRLNDAGDAFEEQRDLSGDVWGFDGRCAVAADDADNVYLFIGGTRTAAAESERHVFMLRSKDGGDTFAEPKPIDLGKGVCMCCHLSATTDANGRLMLAYRMAEKSVNRDSFVMMSADHGETFEPIALDRWELRACPGSMYSFATGAAYSSVSWRNLDQVYFARLGSEPLRFISPPDTELKRRAAVIGSNAKGETLMAWCEGENFNKPHDLRWQLYDTDGTPISEAGVVKNAFERWGNPAVYSDSTGNFTILY